MALPANFNPATPAGTDSPAQGDDHLRQIKQSVIDTFGIPSATNITAAYLVGGTAGILAALFEDAAAASTTAGRLQRNGKRLVWGAGDQSGSLISRATFGTVGGNVGAGDDALTSPIPVVEANFFTAAGHSVLTIGTGAFAATGSVKTLRFQVAGGWSVVLNPATPSPNGASWFALLITQYVSVDVQSTHGIAVIQNLESVMVNLTSNSVQSGTTGLFFSGESGSAASNDIVQHMHLTIRM